MVVVEHQDKVLLQHVEGVEQRGQHAGRRQFAGWFLQQGKQGGAECGKYAPHGAHQACKKDSRRTVFVFQRKPRIGLNVLRQPSAGQRCFAIPRRRDDERKRLGMVQSLQQPGRGRMSSGIRGGRSLVRGTNGIGASSIFAVQLLHTRLVTTALLRDVLQA